MSFATTRLDDYCDSDQLEQYLETNSVAMKPGDRIRVELEGGSPLSGTFTTIEDHALVFQAPWKGRRRAFRVPMTELAALVLEEAVPEVEVSPVCGAFKGDGRRCGKCRYLKDLHEPAA